MSTRGDILRRAAQVELDAVPEPWRASDDEDALATVSDREHYRKNLVTLPDGAGEVPAYVWDFPRTPTIPDEVREEWTRGSAGRMLGRDGKYVSRGSDVPRKSFDGEEPGLLVEAAGRTNHVTDSSDLSAGWATFGTSNSAASNLIEGESAQSVSAPTKSDRSNQGAGTFSSGTETVYVILEEETAGQWALSVLDASASSDLCFVQHDFRDDSLFVARGSVDRKNLRVLSESGPNGGRVYQLVLSYSGQTSGNTREVRVYPDRTSSDNSTIFHHVQLEEAPNASSPIVTNGSATTRAGDDYAIFEGGQPSWWNPNGMTMQYHCVPQFYEQSETGSHIGWASDLRIKNKDIKIFDDSINGPSVNNVVDPYRLVKISVSVTPSKIMLSANGSSDNSIHDGSLLKDTDIKFGPDHQSLVQKLTFIPRALPESTLNRITS